MGRLKHLWNIAKPCNCRWRQSEVLRNTKIGLSYLSWNENIAAPPRLCCWSDLPGPDQSVVNCEVLQSCTPITLWSASYILTERLRSNTIGYDFTRCFTYIGRCMRIARCVMCPSNCTIFNVLTLALLPVSICTEQRLKPSYVHVPTKLPLPIVSPCAVHAKRKLEH